MIDRKHTIKIIDFGLSKKMKDEYAKTNSKLGNPIFRDPWIDSKYNLTGEYGFEADLYSLGLVFYVMLYGKLPFMTKDMNLLQRAKMKNKITYDDSV